MMYFAYGSNMDWDQMQERCPSARFVGIARLPEHRLAFTRFSKKRKCGVADVVPAAGESVWGVVFSVEERDLASLDKSEGFVSGRAVQANSYLRVEKAVFPPEGETPWTVWTYIANRQPNPPLPSEEYVGLIVRGAEHWHLPPAYISVLKKTKVGGASTAWNLRVVTDPHAWATKA